ncbi:hypothetical protein SAY87_010744 [Trapa incisa]|uniref:Secreted protein n=1 Tax=Trapa incisa TaxID=236973 RepID=A0AAN7GWV3_9MYRT|nr:hypothetical protein SAY87_010744 [Trapa incisa]
MLLMLLLSGALLAGRGFSEWEGIRFCRLIQDLISVFFSFFLKAECLWNGDGGRGKQSRVRSTSILRRREPHPSIEAQQCLGRLLTRHSLVGAFNGEVALLAMPMSGGAQSLHI